jgi:hypothetical protein
MDVHITTNDTPDAISKLATMHILKKYYCADISEMITNNIYESRAKTVVFCGRHRMATFANWRNYMHKCMTPFLYRTSTKTAAFKN